MKKYIYILSCMLAGVLAGCTETEKIGPGEYSEPANIEVSSTKLIFDVDGGCAAIVVATNVPEWEYVSEGEWFTVEKKGDNILEVNASMNTGASNLTGSVTIRGEKDGTEVSVAVSLAQSAERSVDLSAAGTSNCYLAKTNMAYKFDAKVKGNGKTDGRSTYIQKYGVAINDVAYADLLWEARNDGDRSMSREIIDGAPIYKNGFISFRTGRSQGNAVIAVRDIKGNILWSWHIWVCNDEIKTHDQINSARKVAGQIMDRNLGALNNTPMDIDNRGMFYQWGRKDPFLPSRSPYFELADGNNVPALNATNDETGNGSGKWQFNTTMQPLSSVPGNIPNTIGNPMTYLVPYYSNYFDWYCSSDDAAVVSSGLWSVDKTIFDPCPVGYRVPGQDTWAIPSGNKTVKNGGPVADYDENGESPLWDWNVAEKCGRKWKYTGDYYPFVGNIFYGSINNTTHNYASGQAFYWTGHQSPDMSSAASYRMDFNPYWAQYWSAARVYSAQIRCVKE